MTIKTTGNEWSRTVLRLVLLCFVSSEGLQHRRLQHGRHCDSIWGCCFSGLGESRPNTHRRDTPTNTQTNRQEREEVRQERKAPGKIHTRQQQEQQEEEAKTTQPTNSNDQSKADQCKTVHSESQNQNTTTTTTKTHFGLFHKPTLQKEV